MSYQIYFADLKEENRALVLTLLRLKAEGGPLEPGEAELLTILGGRYPPASRTEDAGLPVVEEEEPTRPHRRGQQRRRSPGRPPSLRSRNGRGRLLS